MSIWGIRRGNAGSGQYPKVKQYNYKLDERLIMTFDANGNATGQLSPGGARERWQVTFVSVSVTNIPTNSFKVPTLIMYRSAAVPGNQLGGTYTGTLDADSQSVYDLNMNEPIVFVFSGGDVGSIGNVHIEGIRYVWE